MGEKMKRNITLAGAAILLLLAAACSSGGIGDILGGGSNTNGTAATQIRGTVDSVDTNSQSIYLTNVSGNGSMLSSGGSGTTTRVYYDNRTSVSYNGQTFRPTDLERGDQVDVYLDRSNSNQPLATSMNVVYNARTGNTYPSTTNPSSTYPSSTSTVHGIVRSLDTYRNQMTVQQSYNNATITVPYNTNTPVYYNGATYSVSQLEVGDEIDIRMNGSYAQDITVTRSMSSNTGVPGSTQYSTIRGTVRFVDTNNHTIQLDSPSWISNFNRGSATTPSTVYVTYNPNMSIMVNGQSYAISGLERGDVIDVQVSGTNTNSLYAQSISLVRDVRQ